MEGEGFEPPNPKERIYSPPRLASSLPFLIIELMARDGIEPPTHGASIHCSTNWATEPNCGSRIWTYDLRVMSPTSYQLLHPAINGGGRRIRTFEVEDGRFTVCSLWPLGNPSINKMELAIGIEPTTCWLQVSCSTYWATPASLRQDELYHLAH